MSLFKKKIIESGLSIRGAADYLGVSVHTIKSWSNGRRTPPPGALREMDDLIKFLKKTLRKS